MRPAAAVDTAKVGNQRDTQTGTVSSRPIKVARFIGGCQSADTFYLATGNPSMGDFYELLESYSQGTNVRLWSANQWINGCSLLSMLLSRLRYASVSQSGGQVLDGLQLAHVTNLRKVFDRFPARRDVVKTSLHKQIRPLALEPIPLFASHSMGSVLTTVSSSAVDWRGLSRISIT